MTYFLEQVAKQIYESCKNDLSRQCVVFPNRRSGLFFMEYLSALSDKPVWAPKTITINELFSRCSDLEIAPTEVLVYELYKIYIRLDAVISRGEKKQSDCVKIDETFDSFYFWGEMLVNDFDDIDKYIVNAKDLYTNLKDLHDIDDKFGGLSHEQIEIIRNSSITSLLEKILHKNVILNLIGQYCTLYIIPLKRFLARKVWLMKE